MVKTTFREIKQSFGRYMAILMIVALGVGFFSGLKVTHDAMVGTADDYLQSHHFFDYRLISTLGFDEDSIKTLLEQDEVERVEGVKSQDALILNTRGSQWTVKTMSVPKEVNQSELIMGKMPEKIDECVVDLNDFSEDAVGKTIKIADTNEKDTIDSFKVKEFTITGLVRSPLYIRYDRGTTSIGNGTIDAYVYVMPEVYDMDYFTEVYITFDKKAAIYSEDYKNFMDEKRDEWEDICQTVADDRYEDIYADGKKELEEAQEEFNEKSADGKEELAKAFDTLEEGKKSVAEGESALATAKNEIAKNEKKLEQSEKQYQSGLKTYQTNKKKYDTGKAAYDKGKAEYDANYATYQNSLATYNQNEEAYKASLLDYNKKKEEYEAGKAYLGKAEQEAMEEQLATWKAGLDSTAVALQGAKKELDSAYATLSAANATLVATKSELTAVNKQLKAAKKQLESAREEIDNGKEALQSAKTQIVTQETKLGQAKDEIADGQEEYDTAYAEYQEQVADADEELKKASKDLADLEKPDTYVLGRETNVGYASFENDSKIVMGIANVFPVFFFLVAALVCITTMTRMMEEQRTQVGVLKALGYSSSAIIGKYMVYSGSAALIGAVSGFFAGTWVFPEVIWTVYKMMYNMGSLHYVFDGRLAVISIVVAFLCSAGTTFLSCNQELREMAASLMRPKTPRAGKRVLLENVTFIWNHLKFLDKVSVRNVFRYKKRFFMMIIGISGCTALMVTGFGIKDSIANIAELQFGDIFVYDLDVNLDDDEPVGVDGIKESLLVSGKSIDLKTKGKTKSVNLIVPFSYENFSDYVKMSDKKGNAVDYPKVDEVVISSKLAEDIGIKVGDEITLQNGELAGGTVKVAGIYQNYFNHYAYITPQTYEHLFKAEADYNEMFVNIEEAEDEHVVAANLMKEANVGTVTVNADIKKNVADMMESLNYVVILVIFCAALLAFIVIYNLNNINITERVREIATIKVLGFYKEETSSYIFRENVALTFIGSLLGLLLGHFLHAFVMSQINIDAVAFDVRVTGFSYLLSILLTFLFNLS